MKEERLPVAAPALRLQGQGHQELGAQARQEVREQQVGHKNQVRLERNQLQVGQLVLVQNTDSNLWDQFGTIIEVRPDNLSYLVRLHNRVFCMQVQYYIFSNEQLFVPVNFH